MFYKLFLLKFEEISNIYTETIFLKCFNFFSSIQNCQFYKGFFNVFFSKKVVIVESQRPLGGFS